MNLLAFGEILWDVYPTDKYLGGAPLNFGAHFVKKGGNCSLLTAVCNDDLGNEAIAKAEFYNIDTKYIKYLKKQTGRCNVTLDGNMIPSYDLLNDVAYDYISTDEINEDFDVLYFGTLSLRNGFNRNTLEKLIKEKSFGDIFVDINIRPPYYSKDVIKFCVENATIIKISDEELDVVAKNLSVSYKDIKDFSCELFSRFANLKQIIITLGDKGAFVLDTKENKTYSCPAKQVKVVSTVGAGDSFGASYLYDYLCNKPTEICLKNATEHAAFVVSHKAAVPD